LDTYETEFKRKWQYFTINKKGKQARYVKVDQIFIDKKLLAELFVTSSRE